MCADVANANNEGLERYHDRESTSVKTKTIRTDAWTSNFSNRSNWWTVEPDVGRVAHGIPSRVDRLKCLGNAVVPQQVYPILKAIAEIERGEYFE